VTTVAMIAAIFFGQVDVPHPDPDPVPYVVPEPWASLAECESHSQWDYGKPGTHVWGSRLYEGALQFHPRTWAAFAPEGFPERAYDASPAQQVAVGERVLEAQTWKAWPACSRALGLRP
jgi:resuscitation-promoting factor RpfA